MSSSSAIPAPLLTPGRERSLLWLLALTQFTIVVDFMVMMPLGPQIMQAFTISPAAFAAAVSAYSWCAGISGLLAATYIDRFDRRKMMLAVYALFALSNLICALATNYHALLLSRAFAGLTGGVLSSLVLAIIGDVIPPQRRGAAMGVVMTSFSLAAVAGVPLGVVLGAHYGWSSPFFELVLLSALIWGGAWKIVPSLTAHIRVPAVPLSRTLPELRSLMREPAHLRGYGLTAIVMGAHMMIVPFISPTLVGNLGVRPEDISLIYMAGGFATFFSARAVGRLADRFGTREVFRAAALASLLPALFITHLPQLPLWALIVFFPFFLVTANSRMIPVQALLTTVPEAHRRGAFMSVNSAVQQIATGTGAWIGGLMLSTSPSGRISGYGANGWLCCACIVFAMWWVGRVRPYAYDARDGAAARTA
ncbi:MFS transporter [Bordetella bronchialis]|uniref:MFS transporter n=1 Tax=Bordetella bronchialis TaxID=463025 RepID=A0A193G3W2_9BORD|nr:MFS transporter [Bordetella bronchialis]ANN69390.1 MFS transporter [Bordetella bronchialis]ANN74535.1 MFS transporter [Bordetella bronchialis]